MEPGLGMRYRSGISAVSRVLNYIGIAFLMVMMLVTVVDVSGRFFFNKPLLGTFEMVQYTMVCTVFFCLGHTQIERGNIAVEVLVDRLPMRAQHVIGLVTTVISVALIAVFAYASVLHMVALRDSNSMSGVLLIPDYPFEAVVALGYGILTLVLISDTVVLIAKLTGKGEEAELVAGAPEGAQAGEALDGC